MDFAALPPEINSGRMYAGAGAGPMVAAAAAWDGLAAELSSAANSYRGVISELTGGPWVGPSAMTMAAAVAPYIAWVNTTAVQAELTASQLGSAIAAYEEAFAATVPPAEIEVNRALLAALVATNILGQNTPAIAATEALYAEMWAQDAMAMYGYAGASAAATKLTAFTAPPETTDQAGAATQAAAVSEAAAAAAGPSADSGLTELLNLVPSALQSLGMGGAFDPAAWLQTVLSSPTGAALNVFTTNLGNWALTISGPLFTASGITPLLGGLYGLALPATAAADAAPDLGAVAAASDVAPAAGLGTLAGSYTGAGAPVSAGLGEAASVGKLSVPQSWVSSPAIRLVDSASQLATAGLEGVAPAGTAAPGSFFGAVPPVGSVVNAPRGEQARARSGQDQKVVPALPGDSNAEKSAAAGRPAQPQPARRLVASALSAQERDELEKLRKEIADLATERDAAARLIKEAML
ncbi:PPE domain-containing protein [Mycobacterium palustre]|nr:PPE domain-containing protein [Mycobacterium palustre]